MILSSVMMRTSASLKSVFLFVILGILGFWVSFAGSEGEIMTTGGFLHFLFSLFSWIWILPAYLAGIFLTNSWVYGSVLGMDSFLWLIWNLMKNISNFLLAFFFIYLIIQALFSEKSATSIVKDGLLKILVSGIAIQSSWFLTSVLLDISTISTAAVGSLASQLISANPQLQNTITLPKDTLQALYKQMDQSASIASGYLAPLHLNLFPEAVGSTKSLFKVSAIKPAGAGSGMNQEEVVDLFMPNAQTLAWPLIYIGVNILDSFAPQTLDLTVEDPSTLIASVLINGGGIALYAIAMILLCIIAFMRILYLWIFIALSPLLVLLFCFKHLGKKANLKFLDDFTAWLEEKGIGVSSILFLIFKPVWITLAISASLIFATLMQGVVQRSHQNFAMVPGSHIRYTPCADSNVKSQTCYDTSFVNHSFSLTLKGMTKTFGDVILTLLTLFFMRFILKLAIISKSGAKDNLIDKASRFLVGSEHSQGLIGQQLGSLPIVPLGNGKFWGTNLFKNDQNTGLIDKLERQISSPAYLQAFRESSSETIDNFFWIDSKRLTSTEIATLSRYLSDENINLAAFAEESQELLKKDRNLFDNPEWIKLFRQWKQKLQSSPENSLGNENLEKFRKAFKQSGRSLTHLLSSEDWQKLFWGLFGYTNSYTSEEEAINKLRAKNL